MRALTRRSIAGCAMAVLAPFALAACDAGGGEPEPEFTDSSSAASTESSATDEPSPSGPVEPTLPAEAEEDSRTGAEAFIRHYWEVVNYAQKTGDTDPLKVIQFEHCEPCTAATRSVEKIYRRGGRVSGGSYKVIRARATETPTGSWAVVVRLRVGRQIVTGAGDMDQEYEPGTTTDLFTVRRTPQGWRVASWEPL